MHAAAGNEAELKPLEMQGQKGMRQVGDREEIVNDRKKQYVTISNGHAAGGAGRADAASW